MQDVSLLIEALPFIRNYKGKTFVLKLGGEVVQGPHLAAIAHDVARLTDPA